MYTDASVKQAYAKSKAQLLAELGARGWHFYAAPNKDEAVSAWLQEFAHDDCGPLCVVHGDVRDTSAVR